MRAALLFACAAFAVSAAAQSTGNGNDTDASEDGVVPLQGWAEAGPNMFGQAAPLYEGRDCPSGCQCQGDNNDLFCRVGDTTLHLQKGDGVMEAECSPPLAQLTVLSPPQQMLPPTLDGLKVTSCGVSAPWADVLRGLGLRRVRRLTLQQPPIATLAPSLFSGLSGTEALTVESPQPPQWSPGAGLLAALPSLLRLTVRYADVHLATHAFQPQEPNTTHALQRLELTMGPLTLENEALLGLPRLKLLILWKSELRLLPKGALRGLDALQSLELSGTLIESLEGAQLEGAGALRELHAKGCPLRRLGELAAGGGRSSLSKLELGGCVGASLQVDKRAMAALPGLASVRLDGCGVSELPEDALVGSAALRTLSLANNRLTRLPATLLQDQQALESLDLSGNAIAALEPGTFNTLESLKTLQLDNNNITELPKGLFKGARSLATLSARRCGLSIVSPLAWAEAAKSLRTLILERNNLTLEGSSFDSEDGLLNLSSLHLLPELTTLRLAYNRVPILYDDWRLNVVLRTLDLSHNRIEELRDADLSLLNSATVDLRHNNVSKVALTSNMEILESGPSFLLDHNPFDCDCRLQKFVALLKVPTLGRGRFNASAASCASPRVLRGRALLSLLPSQLLCPLPAAECVSGCDCAAGGQPWALWLSCRELPSGLAQSAWGQQQLRLRLTTAPSSVLRLPSQLVALNLSSLGLSELPELQAQGLQQLDLRDNELRAAPRAVLQDAASALQSVMLHGNPLLCNCADVELLNQTMVWERDSLRCEDSAGRSWLAIAECQAGGVSFGTPLAAVLLAVLAAGAVLLLLLALLRRRRAALKAKDADALDADATYDVFVSYAHEDEAWVATSLVPALEAKGHRLCVHHRDWLPGEWIPEQIARSVQSSRRTLVVLSPAFARSAWGAMELRAAAARGAKEGRPRVLVLLLQDVAPELLGEELRQHVANNTYLRADDPRFWSKLQRSLPAPGPSKAAAGGLLRQLRRLLRKLCCERAKAAALPLEALPTHGP